MKIKDRVLIVEDDAHISSFISTILTANDYDVITARTGSEAITTITSHCPDVILLDLGLPDMDGGGILRFVREWSTCPIIVVSARNHERDKVDALGGRLHRQALRHLGTAGPHPHRDPPHPYPSAQRGYRPAGAVPGQGIVDRLRQASGVGQRGERPPDPE